MQGDINILSLDILSSIFLRTNIYHGVINSNYLKNFATEYNKNVNIIRNGTDFNFFSKTPKEIF